ncbi:hypothetical protein Tco_0261684 [Tanacetum coccineum]
MDDPNITMEEYIRLEEEKAQRHGRTFIWQTAIYGKVKYYKDEDDCFTNFETEFPAIVVDDMLTFDATLLCEPTISPLNENKIEFRISFDESDDEDYMVIFDDNSFSYKIIVVDNLKTDSENDNDKVDIPSFPSPEPSVSYSDDLDYFKDFETKFPAIVYNDALTSKFDSLTEPVVIHHHINKLDLKNETSLFECDEEEQNILYWNDLFPLNIIYSDDPKSDKDNDDDKIDITQSSRGNIINIDTKGSNKLLETSHDRIRKIFNVRSFVMELKFNIVGWNCLNNWMPLNLIKNLYVSIGIPFDPKWYYKDGVYTRILLRPRYQVEGYSEDIMHNYEQRLETIFGRSINRVHVLDFAGLTDEKRQTLAGGARRRMTWRQFILALGLHTSEEMAEDSISGREQATKKVTGIDLFYLRSMNRGTANIPYLLAQYLFRHAEGRKSGARLSGGYFIRRLPAYFGLVSDDGLRATRPERQPDAMAGAPEAARDALAVDEGAPADPAPMQAPQPPHAAPKTMP